MLHSWQLQVRKHYQQSALASSRLQMFVPVEATTWIDVIGVTQMLVSFREAADFKEYPFYAHRLQGGAP